MLLIDSETAYVFGIKSQSIQVRNGIPMVLDTSHERNLAELRTACTCTLAIRVCIYKR